jgi:outer membrane protein OmpA-like peptidoglycan-associated protein
MNLLLGMFLALFATSCATPLSYVATSKPITLECKDCGPADSTQQHEVHFDKKSARLSNMAKDQLRELAEALKYDSTNYWIEGHTDHVGSVEQNLVIGEKRANAVKDFLVRENVNPQRLTIISYGKENSYWDKTYDFKNRRVVITPIRD